MNDLIIIGAGGFGREVAWLVERINKQKPTWNIVGFVDDNQEAKDKTINGYKVIGGIDCLSNLHDIFVVCSVGSSLIRKKIIERIQTINPTIKFATVVDPSVDVSNTVSLGDGTIICAHSITTVNICIGNHVIINLDCTIGHDAILEDFVTLYPNVNISGMSLCKECSEIGTGTQIIQSKTVGRKTIVGAGSVVVKDLPDDCTAVGIPCKPIKFHDN